jgi:hypothetical protein
MEFPAARKLDGVTHETLGKSGTILSPPEGPCSFKRVFIETLEAAHIGCRTPCSGTCLNGFVVHPEMPPPSGNIIETGSTSVFIHGLGAARWQPSGDTGGCGCMLGEASNGSRTVFIGGPSGPISPKGFPPECAYLNKKDVTTYPKGTFDRLRGESKVGPGVPGKYTFPGDKTPSDVLVHEVEVKGRKIKVIEPKNVAPGQGVPSADEIGKSLATLPDGQLDSVHQVTASPKPNPDDPHWEKEYKIKGFKSAAASGGDEVTYFPQKGPMDQNDVDGILNHEVGHLLHQKLWQDPAQKKAWDEAMASDGRSPSKYADAAPDEDISESLGVYSASRGSPCAVFARAMFPARFALLDKIVRK